MGWMEDAVLVATARNERREAMCEAAWRSLEPRARLRILARLVRRGKLFLDRTELVGQARRRSWNRLHPRVRELLEQIGPGRERSGFCLELV